MNSKLIGVPVDKLTFVRVLTGIEGFTADNEGSLNTSLHDSSYNSGRMTTHGTLNGVVSDHVYGTFSQSKFAVVGNLMQMCDKNELACINPADTFFWSQNGRVQVPNATLFAPANEVLPEQIEKNVSVIRYDASADGKSEFENLKGAITKHLKKEDIPYFGISMNGWIRNTWVDTHAENSKQIASELSEKLGYKVLNDLHSNTAYSNAEKTCLSLQRLSATAGKINTVEEYEAYNNKSMAQGGVRLFQTVSETISQIPVTLGNIPAHRRIAYTEILEPMANQLSKSMQDKMDNWYAPQEVLSNPVPPPLPPQVPPPLPAEFALAKPEGVNISKLPEPVSHASKFIDAYLRGVPDDEMPVELLQEKVTIADLRTEAEKSINELSYLLAAKGVLWTSNLNELDNDAAGRSPLIEEVMSDDRINRVFNRTKDKMELYSEAFACHTSDVGDFLSEAAARDGIRSDVNELSPFREQLENAFNQDLSVISKHGLSNEEATMQVSRTLASAEPGLINRSNNRESSFVL